MTETENKPLPHGHYEVMLVTIQELPLFWYYL